MKLRLFLFLSMAFAGVANSQIMFQKTYGGPQHETSDCMYRGPGSIARNAEGGYALCHATYSYGVPANSNNEALYFIRIDENGDTVVTRTYYSGGNSIGRSIFEVPGGYLMSANMGGTPGGTSLIRVDAAGDTLWARSFSQNPGGYGGYGFYGFPMNAGNFCAIGEYNTSVQWTSYYGPGLAKVDANGNLIFGKTYYWDDGASSPTQMRFYQGSSTSDGGIIATGYCYGNQTDAVLARFDSTGNVVWAKTYDLSTEETGLMAKEMPDHSIAVTGYVALTTTDWNSFLMKTDASGNILWAHMYGDTLYQWSNSFVTNSSGDFILTGNHQNTPSPFTSHGYLLCVDSTGVIKWGQQYGGNSMDLGCSLTRAADGGYVMLGLATSFGSGYDDLYVVKTDQQGNCGCYTYPLAFTSYPLPFVVTPVTVQTAQPLYANPVSLTYGSGATVTSLCTNVGIEETANENFRLFPNPANEQLKVVPGCSGKISVKLFSVTGEELKELTFQVTDEKPPLEIPLGEMADGVYFLQLRTEKGISTQRFVVQH